MAQEQEEENQLELQMLTLKADGSDSLSPAISPVWSLEDLVNIGDKDCDICEGPLLTKERIGQLGTWGDDLKIRYELNGRIVAKLLVVLNLTSSFLKATGSFVNTYERQLNIFTDARKTLEFIFISRSRGDADWRAVAIDLHDAQAIQITQRSSWP